MIMYEQRTIKTKITQISDKAIITYINLTKGKVHILIKLVLKKKEEGKNLITLTSTTQQK